MANFKGFKQVLKSDFENESNKVGYLWFVRESAESVEGEIYFGSRLYGKVSADVDLTDYYKKGEVDSLLENKLEKDALNGYALESDVAVIAAAVKEVCTLIGIDPEAESLVLNLPEYFEGASTVVAALEFLATKLTEHESAANAKFAEIEGKISNLTVGTVVKEDGKTYVQLTSGEDVISEFDASKFVVDGMLDNVTLEGNELVLTFNTDSGKEAIRVSLESLVKTYVFNESQFVIDGANVSLNESYIKGLVAAAQSGITVVEGNGIKVDYAEDENGAVVTVSAKVKDMEGNFLSSDANGLFVMFNIEGNDVEE